MLGRVGVLGNDLVLELPCPVQPLVGCFRVGGGVVDGLVDAAACGSAEASRDFVASPG